MFRLLWAFRICLDLLEGVDELQPAIAIAAATGAWLAVSVAFWEIQKRRIFGR